MFAGVVFWAIAVRSFPAASVGIAAAAVSALMICNQLAVVGGGSSVIRLSPGGERKPIDLLAAAFKTILVAALAISAVFLLLSAFFLTHLSVIGRTPIFAAAFVITCALGSFHLCANEASVAMGRPTQILVRAVSLSSVMLICLAVSALVLLPRDSVVIFSCWAVGELTAVTVLGLQLGIRPRSAARRIASAKVRTVASTGLANHAVTMADRLPPMLMTILVAEILSPRLGAYWYTAWMAALGVFFIPIYTGTALFAQLVREGTDRAERVRTTLVHTLAVAGSAALAVAVVSHVILEFLGPNYAAHGQRPLLLLLAGIVSVTVLQMYFAVCRATDRLAEAGATAGITGATVIGLAALLARPYGLDGVAAAWLLCETAAAVWAVWRLTRLRYLRVGRPTVPIGESS
jgi:O-antigen/teichoic acid export membrane protein